MVKHRDIVGRAIRYGGGEGQLLVGVFEPSALRGKNLEDDNVLSRSSKLQASSRDRLKLFSEYPL